jgi:hypothetical protein
VRVTVGRVRIAPPTTPWDGPKEEVGLKQLCTTGVEALATFHGAALAGVEGKRAIREIARAQ